MNKNLFTALALGIAVLGTGFATASDAQAGKRMGGFHKIHGHKFHGGWGNRHRHHFRKHRWYGHYKHRWHKRHWYGYAGYYGYRAPNCRYFLRKYRWTGNYYWKRRYNRCVYRFY